MTARCHRRLLLELAGLWALAPAIVPAAETGKKAAGKGGKPGARRSGAKSRSLAPAAERVAEIAAMLSEKPRAPGATIDDRKAWDAAARAPGFGDVVPQAERFAKSPPPELPDDLYLD